MDIVKYTRNQWDRIGAWLCVIAGAICLIVGYSGVSGTLDTGKQLPYVVSGGLVGLFLLGLGALLWLSADLRDEWRKLDTIDRHLVEAGHLPAVHAAGGQGSDGNGRVVPREVSLR
ncbi:MAG TPA: hypothetical protein VHL53_08825 [Acidimicrobiia bacterium]|nr:hypothetical protein [Acidimicrobiia bacterium]